MSLRWLFILLPILYVAGNVYISIRGWQALPHLPIGVKVALSFFYWICVFSLFGAFLFRGLDMPATLAQIISRVGTGWLVFTLYMVLALLLFEALRVLNIPIRHSFLFSFALVVCVLGYGYYRYQHPDTKVINMVINKDIDTGDTRPFRVVAISDVHLGYGTGKRMLARYVDRINAERPDLVLIGGDLIDNDATPLFQTRMEEELSRVNAPMGIYMVPGNHEYISGIEACERFIARTPITLLRDSAVVLPNGIQIVGRDDRSDKRRQSVRQLTETLDKSRPILLLDHQPYDLALTAQAGVDLQFSGHTHRGQVWPLSWLVDRMFELSYGMKRVGDCVIYVSSGLSLWGPPFRIGTNSEMVVFNLTFNNGK